MRSKLYIAFFGILFLVSSCQSKETKNVLSGREGRELAALYEQGCSLKREGKYKQAVISFTQAEEMAESAGSPQYVGAANRELARLCMSFSNYREALGYMKKAVKAFETAGNLSEKNQAFLETGRLYYHLEEYNMANRVLKSSVILAKSQKDSLLESQALQAYSALELARSDRNPGLAIRMLRRAEEELGQSLTPDSKGLMAYALALEQQYDQALSWLQEAKKEVLSLHTIPNETLRRLQFREYQVWSLKGDKERALEALEYYAATSHEIEKEALEQSVIASQREFFEQKSDHAQQQLDNLKLKVIAGLLLINLVAIMVYVFFRNRHVAMENRLKEEKSENERLMSIAEELQDKIKLVSQPKPGRKIQSVKMDVLERLCEQYYIYEGTENLQPRILKEVRSVIEGFREDPKAVEEMLDANYDGLMTDFRRDASFLKEDDIRLYSFVAAGFSSTAISTLIEKEKSVVYNRISRLKAKLNASEQLPDKERYLKMFEK